MTWEESRPRLRISVAASQTEKEGRKFPRFEVELPCLVSTDEGVDWSATAVNLSRGGCAIRSTATVKRGQYLRLLIFSSHSESIEIGLAPVRWATGDRFGVEFILIAPQDVSRLEELLTLKRITPCSHEKT